MSMESKIFEILSSLPCDLSKWLENKLISLDSQSWWEQFVYPNLSYQQTELVNRKKISTLKELDLSALLRIFDKNWYHITKDGSIQYSERNYVKQMQQIRNEFAHLATEKLSKKDISDKLNVISNFIRIISYSEKYKDIIERIAKSESSAETAESETEIEDIPNDELSSEEIKVGDMICLKSDKEKTGAVIKINGSGSEKQYRVFIDGTQKEFYLEQIELLKENKRITSIEEIRSILTAIQINHPSTSNLYSLNAARIDFVPYQFRPVLKIMQSDQPRLLIADSVGVGKTIEAGLILRELQSRNNIETVLIICPKPLVAEKKWYNEMKRFDEKFKQFDGKHLRNCIKETDLDGEWAESHSIIPYSLFDEDLLYGNKDKKKKLGLLDLNPAPKFDLVIVDEAHNIRNSNTFRYDAVKFFCDNAEAVVFLTATPIQLGNQDLYTLLNLLRPDIVIDKETFEFMTEPNLFINEAAKYARSDNKEWKQKTKEALSKAENTPWGQSLLTESPDFIDIKNLLDKRSIGRENRVGLIQNIEKLHSFSNLINRTRRRDIDTFCVRKPVTIKIPFTEEQEKLYSSIITFQRMIYSQIYDERLVNLIMSNICRRTSSCVYGLKPYLENKLERDVEFIDSVGDIVPVSAKDNNKILELATGIIDILDTISDYDPKFEAFYKIVQDKQELNNNKLIVFSTFRWTLFYLQKKLKEQGIRVGLIYGDIKDEERQELRARFEKDKTENDALDVMLFSEVGCEGLDYQFCDAMVNYDLPWNPMKIEQRIGRIDRRGQKNESVVIYNLITENTIEEDIYDRCLNRIGVFESSIGECEEILGEINKGICSIADNFKLSDKDKKLKLEQLADNEIRKINEEKSLEEKQHEFFGLSTQQFQYENDIQNADNYWVSPIALERFVLSYLNKLLGNGTYISGYKDLKNLRISKDKKNILLKELNGKDKSEVSKLWRKWLKSDEQNCPITFYSSCASKERKAQFIMPLHPLVKQSATLFELNEKVYSIIKIRDENFTAGEYYFGIYKMDIKGINEELKLIPICDNEEIQNNLLDILEICSNANFADSSIAESDFNKLNSVHKDIWNKEQLKHKDKTQKICEYRKTSLEKSNKARLNIVQNRLDSASQENIIRMRTAELKNINSGFQHKMQNIENAMSKADVHSTPVVFGILEIEN